MPRPSVLMVDDDVLFCDAVRDALADDDVDLEAVHTLSAAQEAARRPFDVALVDQNLPDGQGLALLERLAGVRVIVISGHAESASAARGCAGVSEALLKPVELDRLRQVILPMQSSPVQALGPEHLELAAKSNAPVLILGETGVGKTVAARAIHDASPRRDHPFVKINCAAVPASLFESELFGVAKGAFTGAAEDRAGLFRIAHGGTLFLDEIAEIPIELQIKLLSALEDGCVRPVGSGAEHAVDVRIIAATNRDLRHEVSKGRFRADLYFRLDVLDVHIPALRARPRIIEPLATTLLTRSSGRPDASLAAGEAAWLRRQPWPGNIRELKNLVERAVLVQPGPTFRLSEVDANPAAGPRSAAAPQVTDAQEPPKSLAEVERAHIDRVLEYTNGHRGRAARILGIGEATLRRKLRKPPAV